MTYLSVHFFVAIPKEAKTAIIFDDIKSSFNKKSFKSINTKKKGWLKRLGKKHSQVKGTKEMQSSNSSDALLMNIFCHPKISDWKGVCNLFGDTPIKNIKFGINPENLLKEGKEEETPTEIDMVINGEIYCEAKLTEKDFTQVAVDKMKKYDMFDKVFDIDILPVTKKNEFDNYQLLRNILAAKTDGKRFILICDARRPDLIRHLLDTVSCIRDIDLRTRCSFICWQDIAQKCGKDLRVFLEQKYSIV
jgi:Restriction Endonuclease associating with ARP